MTPSFSSTQSIPLRSLLNALSGSISASASACPNMTPVSRQRFRVSWVALTGAIRFLNHCHAACNFSPSQSNTGLSGVNSSPTGANAAFSPSTTPPKNALTGSQYLRISNAPATMAATTATTGQLIAPMAVITALPTVVKIAPIAPAAAMMALMPVITGQATRPMAPMMPVSASAPPAIMPMVDASDLFFWIQPSSFNTYFVAVCVSLRSAPSCWSNRSVPTAS